MTKFVSAAALKKRLDAGASIGLLDVREHGQYGEGHLLFASNCPYSRLELQAPNLLPDRTAEIYLYDNDDGVAERAEGRLSDIGYEKLFVVSGGVSAWQAEGFGTYKGVNVPSKVLGELVELANSTPQVNADELCDLQNSEAGVALFDGRPAYDHRKMTVPGAINIPNGEMLYRFAALGMPEDLPIVIHCAGRTRGLIGAQSLINAGFSNPVYALENGTQGWVLSGRELTRSNTAPPLPNLTVEQLERGRAFAQRFIDGYDLPVIGASDVPAWRDECAYLFDVRSEAEFAAGHVPGAVHAPVVQLVQATDEWVAMRRARIALFDDNGVRAALAAFWLRQMGHDAVVVMDGLELAKAPALVPNPKTLPSISCGELATITEAATILDLRSSMDYRAGHIPGAIWAIRPRAEDVLIETGHLLVLVADEPEMAILFASDLSADAQAKCRYLDGGMEAWTRWGGQVEVTPERPTDVAAIDFLFFVHDRHDGNLEASRRYLEWETGLVHDLEPGERAGFHLVRRKALSYA